MTRLSSTLEPAASPASREPGVPHPARRGVFYGVAAFFAWGFIALYFKSVAHVSPLEVLAHRVIWSAVLLTGLLAFSGKLNEIRSIFQDRARMRALSISTVLVAANWLIFIWSITHKHVLEASLGYFINPLVNVLLGTIFLRERLRGGQWLGIAVTTSGVLYQAIGLHHWPVIALALAFTFSCYGMVRKVVRVEPVSGLAMETILLAPLALAYLLVTEWNGQAAFLRIDHRTDILLVAAGVVTAIPLIWFVHATRLLRYATVGVIQYIAPTCQFLLAVFAFHETFTHRHFVSFSLVWCGIGIYLWNVWRPGRTAVN